MNHCQVIPFEEWPDEFFPTNCWGVVYIMSDFVRNKLLKVFKTSKRNKQNNFVTPHKLPGVRGQRQGNLPC